MIDVNRLKGEIVSNGYTQRDIAKKLNMTPETFRRKLKKGVLGSDDMEVLIELLNLKDPMNIFFKNKVT